MIQFDHLGDTPHSMIVEAFNQAFEGYFVHVGLTIESFREKVRLEDLDLRLSVGAFAEEGGKPRLVGFMLHGIREKEGEIIAWNGGTGVIPAYRGQNLSQRMYEFLIPYFQIMGVKSLKLEVIDQNQAAIKTYKNVGFSRTRTLLSYKGKVSPPPSNPKTLVIGWKNPNWEVIRSIREWEPAWQNDIREDHPALDSLKIHCALSQSEFIGYAISNPQSGRIRQFAIQPFFRRQGHGTALFQIIGIGQGGNINLTNIDSSAGETHHFLKSLGLQVFITQYEMEMRLS